MTLNFPHSISVVNLLAAVGTFEVFQLWNAIHLALVFPAPFTADFLDLSAATHWAGSDSKRHALKCPLGRNQEVIGFLACFLH